MVARRSPARTRMLSELGENIARWRKLQGLSASQLAERAHVTRETLRNIESGTGTPRLDSVLAVLTSLGMANTVVASTDPWNSTAGRALMDEQIGLSNSAGPTKKASQVKKTGAPKKPRTPNQLDERGPQS